MKEFLQKIETLDNVTQWAERDSVIKESVSQHSFKVAAICAYILQSVENAMTVEWLSTHREFTKFKYQALSYAILHDFDEAIIGRDISHVIKYNEYNGKEFRAVIDDYVHNEIKNKFQSHIQILVPSDSVKVFVKMCDWIALYTFVKRNIRMGVDTFAYENNYCSTCIAEAIEKVNEMFKSHFSTILPENFWQKTININ